MGIYEQLNKLESKRLQIAIAYFSKEYYEKTKKFPTQTQVYKFLAFIDFISIRERGRPVFGLRYLAMEKGPVPIDLYEETKNIETRKQYEFYSVSPEGSIRRFAYLENKDIDLKYFAKAEVEIINRIIEIFVDKSITTRHYSEASHEDIKAWKKAYLKQPNSIIDYKDEIENEKDKDYLIDILEGYNIVKEI